MDAHKVMERRDPASGVLQLGALLVRALRAKESGEIEVRDGNRVHRVRLVRGLVVEVRLDGGDPRQGDAGPRLQRQVERFFGLPRPHVLFFPGAPRNERPAEVDTESLVLNGVIMRRELFDPVRLADRIPIDLLQIGPEQLRRIRRLPLDAKALAFADRLAAPTPVPLALWKRGIGPDQAAALLVAFNLLGVFDGWEPGCLPRHGEGLRIKRRIETGCLDHEILGIEEDAPDPAVDQAFRSLSLVLHPDRLIGLPTQEREQARQLFSEASEAYTRLKRSRRARQVRNLGAPLRHVAPKGGNPEPWVPLISEARLALLEGRPNRARAFSLKALVLSPPDRIRVELLEIIRKVA